MTVKIEVRPETAAKFHGIAAAQNLSIQEYLEKLASDIVFAENGNGYAQQQEKSPYELGKDFIGSIDSSIIDPDAKPHKTAFGELLVEKYKKQGLRLP